MFSGISNQVSSFSSLFSKNTDEQVPTPPQSATAAAPSEDGQAQQIVAAVSTETAENISAENASGDKQR